MNGSTDSLIGHVFNNTYRIDRLLADGGMGQVYVAEQLSLARLIVLKVLQPGFSDDDFIQLFLREARINSQVNHPNIVSVIDFGQSEEGVVFLAMEFLSGQNVSEWVKCQGAMSLANVVWIMEQVVGGVQAAHKLHFIHRDIKPQNIMISQLSSGDTIAKILDFGISKPLGEEDLRHTQLGMVMGTPGYLSPEQITGKQQISPRTDVYALGALMYYMLTGNNPFVGATPQAVMMRQLEGPPADLLASDVSDKHALLLQPVINRAMMVDAQQRYASVKDLWLDMLICIGDLVQPTLIKPTSDSTVQLYRFVYSGELVDGAKAVDVSVSLKRSFSFKNETLKVLFSGRRVVVRKKLLLSEAQKLAGQFTALGAEGLVEMMPIVEEGSVESFSSLGSMPKAKTVQAILLGPTVVEGDFHSGAMLQTEKAVFRVDHAPVQDSGFLSVDATVAVSPINAGSGYFSMVALLAACLLVLVTVAANWFYPPFNYALMDRWRQISGQDVPVRGVTTEKVVVGMSAAFSGGAREIGRSMRIGIETYFKEVNDRGGVYGRKLFLSALNDGYEPDLAVKNAQQFVSGDLPVLAMLGNVGTPTAKKILPLALQHKLPVIGTFSGASILRNNPPDRYVFNYRASYAEEMAALIHHFVNGKKIPAKNIAVFYQDDGFGLDALQAVSETLKSYGVDSEAIVVASYERNTVQVEAAVEYMLSRQEGVQAIVMVSTYSASAAFIHGMRKSGYSGQLANISFVGSHALAEALREIDPELGQGIIVTQVVPLYDSYASGVIQYRQALAEYYPSEEADFISLEGYIVAKIFVNALQRMGRYFEAEDIISALESLHDVDMGIGTTISFNLSKHQASDKVWGTVLDKDGYFTALKLRHDSYL